MALRFTVLLACGQFTDPFSSHEKPNASKEVVSNVNM
jgi:hypothetical protein